ncbi:hypothetical protein [Herbaspirillum huttiense]|uniref:hypothetical protein n=1 Tax=Herbaspirillum huttiense TaxID=863372 RepID=UPI0039AEFF37
MNIHLAAAAYASYCFDGMVVLTKEGWEPANLGWQRSIMVLSESPVADDRLERGVFLVQECAGVVTAILSLVGRTVGSLPSDWREAAMCVHQRPDGSKVEIPKLARRHALLHNALNDEADSTKKAAMLRECDALGKALLTEYGFTAEQLGANALDVDLETFVKFVKNGFYRSDFAVPFSVLAADREANMRIPWALAT